MRAKTLSLSPGELVALLIRAGVLPGDARPVGGPSGDGGRVSLLVTSGEFAEVPDGAKLPRVEL